MTETKHFRHIMSPLDVDSRVDNECMCTMDPYDRIRIQKNTKAITENLAVDDVLPHLMQDLILNYNDSEVIKHEITKRDQASKLLQVLITRGPTAYESFCTALQEDYGYLATLLVQTSVSPEEVAKSGVALGRGDGKSEATSIVPDPAWTTYRSQSPRPPVTDDELYDIEHELRTHYRTHLRHVTPVPWLDCFQVELNAVYTNLQVVRSLNRNSGLGRDVEEEALVNTNELFITKDPKTPPKRILIEGDPGIGKTTFSCKLCYDWANEEKGNCLEKFSLVLGVRARDLDTKKSIIDCLYEQLLPEDFPIQLPKFKELITSNQQRVLILVEGYDELMEQHSDVTKLVSGKVLSHVSVLVTSRPGYALNILKYFDSIFAIVGYGEMQRLEFINKFSSALANDPDVGPRFEQFKLRLSADEVLSQLCRNPLHLCILCMLLGDAATTSLPQTRTELYQEVEEFILNRACDTLGVAYDELKVKCNPLGVIAFEGLLRGQHQVTEEEVAKYCDVKALQHLGFFCRHVTISKFKRVAMYSFTHKSFQEYFAAKHIAAPRRTKQERLEMARELLESGNSKLVMVFLCGLLRKNNYALVDLIDIIKDETYLPFISTEFLSLHDVNENHSAHTIFHCLREVDTVSERQEVDPDPIQEKLGPRMLSCRVEQISISYPWCSSECLDGVLRLCSLIDDHCFVCTNSKSRKTSRNNNILHQTTSSASEDDAARTYPRRKTLERIDASRAHRGRHKPEARGDYRRPRSLEGLADCDRRGGGGDPIRPPRRQQNVKMLFQRAMAEVKSHALTRSPMEQVRCKKFSVTAPGPLVCERRQLFEKFMRELLCLRHVEAFSMHDVTSASQLQALFAVLAKVGRPRVTSLGLRFVGVMDTVAATPVRFEMPYFLWVQSLTVIDCPNAEVLLSLINAIPTANSVRYLSFIRCTFDKNAFQALCAKFAHMKCLKALDFRQNILGPHNPDVLDLLTSLEHHEHLAHFGISNLTTRIASPVSTHVQLFPKDDTFFNHLSPYLCHIIGSNHLESLCISNSTLGRGLLGILLNTVRDSRTLQKLDIPDNYVLADGYPVLTDLLTAVLYASTIEELNLLGTELNPDNVKAIADVLQHSSCIRGLSLGIYNVDDLNTFSNGLAFNRSLEYLAVRKIIFVDDAIVNFSNAVSKHPFLKTLILSANDMTPVKITHLFYAIKTSSSLENVTLRHFLLEDLHMIEFSQVLGTNENLRKVDLSSNHIGPSGVELLYKKLQYRDKLWKLNLTDNSAKEFHEEVKLLKTRVLYLKVNWF